MTCFFCESAAVAVFNLPEGCACSEVQIQPLCPQHAFKSSPRRGMCLIEDLTVDSEFTLAWTSLRPAPVDSGRLQSTPADSGRLRVRGIPHGGTLD